MREYPNASSFKDRHGKTRWRFRRNGKAVMLPHEPGHPEFEAAYAAAVNNRPVQRPTVLQHPAAVAPQSLRACWLAVQRTPEWSLLDPQTRIDQTRVAERFLTSQVPTMAKTWGDMPIRLLDRKLVKRILADRADTPHSAGHVLRLLRKLIAVALDEEWIEVDPTYRLKYRPAMKGHRAWTETERQAFERHWPIGTTPRLVYALALYTGARRSDIATLRWDAFQDDGVVIAQEKTDNPIWLPIHPELRACLDTLTRTGPVVVSGLGAAYSEKSLGMRFAGWCKRAGVPAGATLHGLRKSMGKALAESGATTKEIMAVLGHEAIEHAQLYSKEAEQRLLAKAAMAKLTRSKIRPV